MDMKQAMRERHVVRKYLDTPLDGHIVEQLNQRVAEDNAAYGTDIRLVVDGAPVLNAIVALIAAKNVNNYFIVCAQDSPGVDEQLGRCSADLMLYAQTLGLNTWWVGGTFNRKAVERQVEPDRRVFGVVVVGYGKTQGQAHTSKRPDEVASYEGDAPEWFTAGVAAALLAPTARNKQAFRIAGSGRSVSFSCDNGLFSGVDAGLVKHHFELGAGIDNFEWAS